MPMILRGSYPSSSELFGMRMKAFSWCLSSYKQSSSCRRCSASWSSALACPLSCIQTGDWTSLLPFGSGCCTLLVPWVRCFSCIFGTFLHSRPSGNQYGTWWVSASLSARSSSKRSSSMCPPGEEAGILVGPELPGCLFFFWPSFWWSSWVVSKRISNANQFGFWLNRNLAPACPEQLPLDFRCPGGEAPGKFLVFWDPDDYKTAKFIENDNLSRRIRRRSSETVPGVECSIKFQIGTFWNYCDLDEQWRFILPNRDQFIFSNLL